MRLSALLLLLLLAVIAAFAFLNWSTFVTPTELSFGFATARMPLGLLMLGLLALVSALFLLFAVYLQTAALLEARRHSRELKASRDLADQAEASRFSELRAYLEEEVSKLGGAGEQTRSEILARIERLEGDLRTAVEQSGNTLAAYIGELEDRVERGNPSGGR